MPLFIEVKIISHLAFDPGFDVLAAYLKFIIAKLLIFERKVNFDEICRNCATFRRKRIFVDISMHLLFTYH